jgi:membrane protease YdiL (CAAX protease family)
MESVIEVMDGAEIAEDKVFRTFLSQALGFVPELVSSLILVRLLSGTRLYQLGLHTERWRQGVLLGALAWLAISPLIFGVDVLVEGLYKWWTQQPAPPHQLEKMIKSEPTPTNWGLLLFMALLVAPVIEEFVFRGVVQRWAAQRASRSFILMVMTVLLAPLIHPERVPEILLLLAVLVVGYLFAPVLLGWAFRAHSGELRYVAERPGGPDLTANLQANEPPYVRNPPPHQDTLDSETTEPDPWRRLVAQAVLAFDPVRQDPRVNAPRAVYATAVLFAVSHLWPTPIPLFLLGLVLGWVAHRTQSLVAPMMLHLLFNAVGCIQLALAV